MKQLTDYERLSLIKLEEAIIDDRWSNAGLVQLIKLAGEYLNIQTIPDYCNQMNISYQGAKKETQFRKIETIFNSKFVIDNN